MKVKALAALRPKFLNSCRKLLRIFRFKIKRPLFIRALRPRSLHTKVRKTPSKYRMPSFFSVFRSPRQSRKMDRVKELPSFSDAARDRLLFPSPLTPAYVKASGSSKRGSWGNEDVEAACRSFENYLVEMIVEEGKMSDLMDVEELLYCWKNLKCPVFIDLVSRFYGELCKDLFCSDDQVDDDVDGNENVCLSQPK